MICHEKLEPTCLSESLFWVPEDTLQDSVELLSAAEQKVVRWAGIYVVKGSLGMVASHNACVTELFSGDDGLASTRSYDILLEGVDPMMNAYVKDCLDARATSNSLPNNTEPTSTTPKNGRFLLSIIATMQQGNEKALQEHEAGLSLVAMAVDSLAALGGEHAPKLAEQGALMYKEAVIMPFAFPNSVPHWTSMFQQCS